MLGSRERLSISEFSKVFYIDSAPVMELYPLSTPKMIWRLDSQRRRAHSHTLYSDWADKEN